MIKECKLCKLSREGNHLKAMIDLAYLQGKSVRSIAYFLHILLGEKIGKDVIYEHYNVHEPSKKIERETFFKERSRMRKESCKYAPQSILEAMRDA